MDAILFLLFLAIAACGLVSLALYIVNPRRPSIDLDKREPGEGPFRHSSEL